MNNKSCKECKPERRPKHHEPCKHSEDYSKWKRGGMSDDDKEGTALVAYAVVFVVAYIAFMLYKSYPWW